MKRRNSIKIAEKAKSITTNSIFFLSISVLGGLLAMSVPLSLFANDYSFGSNGDYDLAVGKQAGGSIAILQNDGWAGFPSAPVEYAAGCSPVDVNSADFDGDGDNDLVVANSGWDIGCDGSLSVLMNYGNGIFAPDVEYLHTWCSAAVPADLDKDGDNDLVVLADSIYVFFNYGDGTFETPIGCYHGSSSSILLADFDGDNNIDLAVSDWSDSLVILKNRGDGTFDQPVYYPVGTYPNSMCSADFDNDGDVDLAVVRYLSDEIAVLLNNGDGFFAIPINITVGNILTSLFAADFDKDGYNDLAIGAEDGIYIRNGIGDGTFSSATKYITGFDVLDIVGGDLDNDGDLDLVTANGYSSCISVLLNDGSGMFDTWVNYGVGNTARSLCIADLNSDGFRDLVATVDDNWLYAGGVSVFLNLGSQPNDVEYDRPAELSHYYTLGQNYPNPFNPTTNIEFTLPVASEVTVEVINILGRRIVELVRDRLPAGRYHLEWNGTDSKGQKVASGIYFYSLRSQDYFQTKKMMLIK